MRNACICEDNGNGGCKLSGYHWIIIELSLDDHWIIFELSLNYHWLAIDLSLNYHGITIELSYYYHRIITLNLHRSLKTEGWNKIFIITTNSSWTCIDQSRPRAETKYESSPQTLLDHLRPILLINWSPSTKSINNIWEKAMPVY